jgi:predicted heme/steroid binding protein
MGRKPGDMIRLSFHDYHKAKENYTQHSNSFLELIEFYYPKVEGIILAVEIDEVSFFYGLSQCLEDKFSELVQEIRKQIIDMRNLLICINNKIEVRKVSLMDEIELKRIIYDYIKEICHFSQMQVFATSTYQKNYFQLQIDETINNLYNFFTEYQGTLWDTQLYTTQQRTEQPEQQSGTLEEQQSGTLEEQQSGSQEEQQSGTQIEPQMEPDENENMRSFTLEELAFYDGKEGRPAYVAINGTVYDVSNINRWAGGMHFGLSAGNDVSDQFGVCHLGRTAVLNQLPIVGILTD